MSPGSLLLLDSASCVTVQKSAPQRLARQGDSALVSGPALMLMITRTVDPNAPGWDDVFVIGPRGVMGWTFIIPALAQRLTHVVP